MKYEIRRQLQHSHLHKLIIPHNRFAFEILLALTAITAKLNRYMFRSYNFSLFHRCANNEFNYLFSLLRIDEIKYFAFKHWVLLA